MNIANSRRVSSWLVVVAAAFVAPWAWAAHAPHSEPVIHVGIVLFDDVEIIDFAGPYEVFGAAGFGVTTVTVDGAPITTAMGLKVTPDTSFANAPPFDVLLVPGGGVREAERNVALLDFIRARTPAAKHVMSVCTGARILAATGLLDGREATTFHRALDRMAADYPKVVVVRDRRWADSGKFITSAGLSSGIDAALHLVEQLRDADTARGVALHLEYDWKRGQGFVRTRMADRYLPRGLDKAVQWPQDMQFAPLRSLGDERSWVDRNRIETAMPAEELLGRIAVAIDQLGSWKREGEAMRWHRDDQGRRVRMVLSTSPLEGGKGFLLEVVVTVE